MPVIKALPALSRLQTTPALLPGVIATPRPVTTASTQTAPAVTSTTTAAPRTISNGSSALNANSVPGNIARPPGSSSSPITPSGTTSVNEIPGLQTAITQANQLLAGHEAARIDDPYAAQTQEFLNTLKNRIGGMNSQEMQAARDQGLLGLDRETNQNLERYASIAGAHGVQGGAAAALMGKALNNANYARGNLERQLLLDNIAEKDKAAQAYGGALSTATQGAYNYGTYNAGAHDRDTAAHLSLPFNLLSIGQANAAEGRSDRSNQEMLDTIKSYINTSKEPLPVKAVEGTTNTSEQSQVAGNQLSGLGADVGKQIDSGYDADWTTINDKLQEAADLIAKQVASENGGKLNQTQLNDRLSEWMWNAGLTSSAENGNALRDVSAGKIPDLNSLVQEIWKQYPRL